MAKSIDVAVKMLEKSISLGKLDNNYYMDYVKLHKLMYLSYCYLYYCYDLELFDENILANDDGPYIDGIGAVPATCGFGTISDEELNKFKTCHYVLPLSYSRNEICDKIIDFYGKLSTDVLVKLVKNTGAYQHTYILDDNNISVHKNLVYDTGREIKEYMDIYNEALNKNSEFKDYKLMLKMKEDYN